MTLNEVRGLYEKGLGVAEVLEEVYRRIEEWDDAATFIFLPQEEEWKALAAEVENMDRELSLFGVPFVVKDNIDVKGWPTTAACPDYSYVAKEDAAVVAELRAAGAIPVGKANMDQFATGLVGVRSPYGVARNAVADGWLPGGSSSGSATSVAAGLCVFSLGTDTAGSGRVPAAFQELIGWKPSRGLLSTRGVVPACASLDCVSVFANTAEDAWEVMQVAGVFDETDPHARPVDPNGSIGPRVGVPKELDFSGDPDTPLLYAAALDRLAEIGCVPVEVDLEVFVEAAKLLYEGPWVAERWAAVGEFVEANPESVHPVTKKILEGSKGWSAVDLFKAEYQLKAYAREADKVWQGIDFLLLPTTPCLYQIDEVLEEPFGTNATLGRYTNFMNLLDLAAVAVPAGRARDGEVPWGVTLAAPSGTDGGLLELAGRYLGEIEGPETKVPVVVCGAHLEGLALNWQLVNRGGSLARQGQTAPGYRMYAMPAEGEIPPRPALVYEEGSGGVIEVEVWELSMAAFGDFVSQIPGPLGIGKVKMEDGSELPGFIAEPRAVEGAEEITSFGGWRAWLGSRD